MNGHKTEEFAVLADNWREAEEAGDRAAAEAFEDELHARLTPAEIRELEAPDPGTGEASPAETERLRSGLERMWENASAWLD